MLLGVVVHPINTLAHPSVPPGYRWAVHAGNDWANVATDSCLNAGWEPDRNTAAIAGEAAAVVGARVARLCGELVEVRTWQLDHDPILPGRDLITIGG